MPRLFLLYERHQSSLAMHAAASLREAGLEVMMYNPSEPWLEPIATSAELIDQCDAIVTLPGRLQSPWALAEFDYAGNSNVPVIPYQVGMNLTQLTLISFRRSAIRWIFVRVRRTLEGHVPYHLGPLLLALPSASYLYVRIGVSDHELRASMLLAMLVLFPTFGIATIWHMPRTAKARREMIERAFARVLGSHRTTFPDSPKRREGLDALLWLGIGMLIPMVLVVLIGHPIILIGP